MKDELKQWPHERIAALEAALRQKDADVADAISLVLCHEAKIDRLAAEVKERDGRIEQLTGHLDWLGWSSDGIAAARQQLDELRKELDGWKRQWHETLERIGGTSNEDAARKVADEIVRTLGNWRRARSPGPLMVEAIDSESFVRLIQTAISARTEELEAKLVGQ
jgi:chromosome segregation ATPase